MMSYDCSGLPGNAMAVTHLVCAVVGAPGPWHTAAAGVLTAMLPKRTSGRALDRYVSDLKSLIIRLLPRGYTFIEPPFGGCFAGVEIHDSNNPDAPMLFDQTESSRGLRC